MGLRDILLQELCKDHTCMTDRMILHDSLLLVAQPLVEARGLKSVRRQEHHLAAFRLRVFLGGVK